MLGIVFSIDICTLHRISSKNVDLNMCAHTWHSVSVMGYKQSFDLAVPAFIIEVGDKKLCINIPYYLT